MRPAVLWSEYTTEEAQKVVSGALDFQPSALRLLIVADDVLARAGLAALLAGRSGGVVVGQAASDMLPDAWAIYRPDLAIWDLGWNPELLPESLAEGDSMAGFAGRIVALLPDESAAAEVWGAGVRGLLLRDSPPEALLLAAQAVLRGLVVLDPLLASQMLTAPAGPLTLPTEALTPRETEVLRLLAEGLPNKAIAVRLGISDHTVKFHVNAILRKLDAQSRTDAVTRAARLGLIIL